MKVIRFCAHFSTLVSVSFFKSIDELRSTKTHLKLYPQMTDYPECPSEASMSEEVCQEGQTYSRDYISVGLEMAAGWTHVWMPVVSPKRKCQNESWNLDWSLWHPVVLHSGMFTCPAIKHSHISMTDPQLRYTLLSDVPVHCIEMDDSSGVYFTLIFLCLLHWLAFKNPRFDPDQCRE